MKQKNTYKRSEVKIVPLGGVEEIGINSTAFQINDEIIVIDSGMGFPEEDQYGVDFLIPNSDFLERNKKNIKAMFITHGHLDHIGALHITIPKLGYPKIFAPKFAYELIKVKLEEEGIWDKVDISIFNEDSEYKYKEFIVKFFRVNHSTPDSYGICLSTKLGNVIHTGDFKFDNSPVGEEPSDYSKIAKFGREGVLALLSDSTNAFKKGHSKSESDITEMLMDVVEKAEGRIIVATFSQLVLRINQLLIAAEKQGRKVSISGRSLEKTVEIAKKFGYIKSKDDLFVPIRKIEKLPSNKQMIFTTGHQGETMAALSRIARGEHRDVKIKKGDTVILSSSIIPGNELIIQKMIDDLSILGARVYHQNVMDLHAGGHGYQEDQKLMINLTKPKFFIPVHGYQSFLIEHGRTAVNVGVKEKNVIIPKRGQEILIEKDNFKFGKQFRSKPILVSGYGVGDIGDTILAERDKLAKGGILVVNLELDSNYNILNKPTFISKGFVFIKFFGDLEPKLRSSVLNSYSGISKLTHDNISFTIRKDLSKLILKELDREPEIVVNIFQH